MVREAALEQTDAGLVPAGEGWFVLNARDARWRERPQRGFATAFEGLPLFTASRSSARRATSTRRTRASPTR